MEPILIAGTGALACLFAARLAVSGTEVTMLGTWTEGLDALRSHGVRLVSPSGEESCYRVRAISNPADCSSVQLALVLVKSWQTARTANQLARCLSADGCALTLQNGLGNREALAGELGATRVAMGSTTTGATLLGPGRVRPGGEGEIHIENHPSLDPLMDQLKKADFAVHPAPDVAALVWGKLVINAAINPLTALLEVPNGELLNRPSAHVLMSAAAREAALVAAAKGIDLPFEDSAAAAERVARRTAANHSSMLQDVLRGAPTEIDAICGEIVAAAADTGLDVPVNETLWRLVRAKVGGDIHAG